MNVDACLLIDIFLSTNVWCVIFIRWCSIVSFSKYTQQGDYANCEIDFWTSHNSFDRLGKNKGT